jgi:hypothetical protein
MVKKKDESLPLALTVVLGAILFQYAFGILSGLHLSVSKYLPNPSIVWVVVLALHDQSLRGVILTWLLGLMVDLTTANHLIGPWTTAYLGFYLLVVVIPSQALNHSYLTMVVFSCIGCLCTDFFHDVLVFETWSSYSFINDSSHFLLRTISILVLSPLVYFMSRRVMKSSREVWY